MKVSEDTRQTPTGMAGPFGSQSSRRESKRSLAAPTSGQTSGEASHRQSPPRRNDATVRSTPGGMPRHEPSQLAVLARPTSTLHQLAGGSPTFRGGTGLRSGPSTGERGGDEDLEGEPSPWETRAMHRWKRRWVATDSSAEQGPEVSCSTGAALTEVSGNGRPRRRHTLRCGRGVRVARLRPARLGRPRNAL
jgi:hypothetical protein